MAKFKVGQKVQIKQGKEHVLTPYVGAIGKITRLEIDNRKKYHVVHVRYNGEVFDAAFFENEMDIMPLPDIDDLEDQIDTLKRENIRLKNERDIARKNLVDYIDAKAKKNN